jgi:hypothetical protein
MGPAYSLVLCISVFPRTSFSSVGSDERVWDNEYDGQAFLRSYDSTQRPSPSPPPISRQQVVSLSQSYCVSPITGDMRGGGGGRARNQIIRPRESLVLYKSFNTLWFRPFGFRSDTTGVRQCSGSVLVFWPPGSVSQRYVSGSGSIHHQAKIIRKTFISTVLWLLCDFIFEG